jgi:hypothetical protein
MPAERAGKVYLMLQFKDAHTVKYGKRQLSNFTFEVKDSASLDVPSPQAAMCGKPGDRIKVRQHFGHRASGRCVWLQRSCHESAKRQGPSTHPPENGRQKAQQARTICSSRHAATWLLTPRSCLQGSTTTSGSQHARTQLLPAGCSSCRAVRASWSDEGQDLPCPR